MSSAPHVIQRNQLRLRLAPGTDGRAVQKRAEAVLQSRALLDALDAALSANGRADEWLMLDRLELDLGRLDSAQLERQLLDRLPDLLRRQVAEARVAAGSGAVSSEAAELHTAAGSAWAAWLHFLHHGTLPAHWPTPVSIAAWEAELLGLLADSSVSQRTDLQVTLRRVACQQRLIQQFSVALVIVVLGALDAGIRSNQEALCELLGPLAHRIKGYSGQLGERLLGELVRQVAAARTPDWAALLTLLSTQPTPAKPAELTQLARAALAILHVSAPSADAPATTETIAESASEAESEFVNNAGVVLLHPFLSTCFAACGWLANEVFVNETARAKAVLMVHFLATGATQAPEYELRLPKLLCGMPTGTALSRRRLSRAARAEGLALLTAAIAHWPALKNTSPDGLREAFLQREGKLEQAPDGHYFILTVEQRAQDVLLDRLPYGWGLGLVQLPWMPERLAVNWA